MSFGEVWMLELRKNIFAIHLDNAPPLPTEKKTCFGKFCKEDFTMEDQLRSGRPSEIEDDVRSL